VLQTLVLVLTCNLRRKIFTSVATIEAILCTKEARSLVCLKHECYVGKLLWALPGPLNLLTRLTCISKQTERLIAIDLEILDF